MSQTVTEIIHACPGAGEAVTSCCGRTPFELPRTDRMTVEPELVTCIVGDAPPVGEYRLSTRPDAVGGPS